MRTVFFLVQKEFLQIFRNRVMLPLLLVMPVFQTLLLAFAANYEIKNLSLGVVDCAITSNLSANSASWPEVSTHLLPIGLQFAMNGYAIGLSAWKKLTPAQQTQLQAAFTALENDIWKYSEDLAVDAANCNTGKDPCTLKKFKMASVPVTAADITLVQNAMRDVSLPTWTETCEKTAPGCAAEWRKTVGAASGMK